MRLYLLEVAHVVGGTSKAAFDADGNAASTFTTTVSEALACSELRAVRLVDTIDGVQASLVRSEPIAGRKGAVLAAHPTAGEKMADAPVSVTAGTAAASTTPAKAGQLAASTSMMQILITN